MGIDGELGGHRRVGAVVLAAGRSTRMGQPKQLLRVNGRTLLENTLLTVRGSAVDAIVLVLGHAAEEIRSALPAELFKNVTVIVNEGYAEGMSSSLRIGLAALDRELDAALIVLADQPFVKQETMDRILNAYQQSDAEIVVPYCKGKRGNPVLLDRKAFPDAMKLQGDMGFRAIFGRYPAGLLAVDVDDDGVLLDIDSWGDYERLRKRSS